MLKNQIVRVKTQDNISKELQEVAPVLLGLDRTNFYQVPEGYFDRSMLAIIELVDKPETGPETFSVLASLPKTEISAVPIGYFSSYSDELIQTIRAMEVAEELQYTSHLLAGVEKKEMYQAPVGYFASFPDAITRLAVYEEKEHPAIVERWTHRWAAIVWDIMSRTILRPQYAFAMACLVGMVMGAGLVVNNGTYSTEDKIFAQIEQVPVSEIHSYMAQHHDEFDEHTILHHINDTEFTHYFDKASDVTPQMEGELSGITEETID